MAVVKSPMRIAILGATGGTGRATLQSLLSKSDLSIELRVFVRSKEKFYRLFPTLKSNANCEVWEGELTSIDKITECLSGANIIICTLGENQNIPGINVLRVAAASIVSALRTLKAQTGNDWHQPRLLLLSSATWNPRLSGPSGFVLWLIKTAFHYPYVDLLGAHATLAEADDLLSLLLVQPPAIIDEAPTGFEISTEKSRVAVSYADLGAGFAELATEDAYRQLSAVGVTSLGGDQFGKYASEILSRVFFGLVSGYLPGYWFTKRLIVRIMG
ncbi:hypothetical protein TruAng_011132 [Truncatella angustata]|nr:hypothetical protein TruAng_011132 [Truncatella angustata]